MITLVCAGCKVEFKRHAGHINDPERSFCNSKCMGKSRKRENHPCWLGDKWSRKFDKCIKCGTTEIIHVSKGRCRNCYQVGYNKLAFQREKERDKARGYHELRRT